MAKGPKVTRRDLREDKIYVTLAGTVEFVVRNRLWFGAGVLVVIVAFAVGYLLHLRSQSLAGEASWALYQASFAEGIYGEMAELQKVAADYPGTPAGRFAAYQAADTLYEDGRYEEAIAAFQEFIKENPRHFLVPSAMEAIGFCRESLGQWNEAIEMYMELMRKRPESPAAARVNYRIGHCYEQLGQKEKAVEAYENTLELLPGTLWAEYAGDRLSILGPAVPAPDAAAVTELMTGAAAERLETVPTEAPPAETVSPETDTAPPAE
jgi:tetratricopeptide (TPR) repeat protein